MAEKIIAVIAAGVTDATVEMLNKGTYPKEIKRLNRFFGNEITK
ncbi:MAG: hypothetical protein RR400_00910 [Clostridia bacterium]